VPVITNIKITMKNPSATFQSGYSYTNYVGDNGLKGPYLGGPGPLTGMLVLWAGGVPAAVIDMGLLGGPPGIASYPTLLGLPMTVTGGPWVTGPVTITSITTNVISVNGVTGVGMSLQPLSTATLRTLSTGGGFVSTNGGRPLEQHTVTISGSNDLVSTSVAGTVTLVAPMRINTTTYISGRIPAAAWMHIVFTPEPGTMLLLVTGAIGLAVMGRRRIRR
jgi:hypothetical protein